MVKILITENQFNSLQEALATAHMVDRMAERIHDLDLPQEIISKTREKLNQIKQTNFDMRRSFAIRLSSFTPVKSEETKDIYVKINGRPYYKHRDYQGKTSIGDEFWTIVRDNKMVTFLLRKSEESDKGIDFLKSLLNVDVIEL